MGARLETISEIGVEIEGEIEGRRDRADFGSAGSCYTTRTEGSGTVTKCWGGGDKIMI